MRPRIAACVLAMCMPLLVSTVDGRVDEPRDFDPALLKLRISLDKEAYEVGEPITADIAITNLSKGPIRVSETSESTGVLDGYTVVITASDGQVVPPIRLARGGSYAGRSVLVQPGETYHHSLVTNYQVAAREPGDYIVKVAFATDLAEKKWAESPPVKFSILPTTEEQLGARVEQLKRRLAAGDRPQEVAPLLGMTGSTAAIPPLIDMLQSSNYSMQYRGGQALEMIDLQAVKEAVLGSLKQLGPREYMVNMMERVLRVDGDAMVDALLPWLKDHDADRRYAAMYGLDLCWTATGRGDVRYNSGLAGLKDEAARVRSAAIDLLASSRRPGVLAALLPLLNDADESVRCRAVTGLASQGTPEAVDALIGVLDHQQGRPANDAAYCLAMIGGEKADKAISDALARSQDPNLKHQIESGREQAKFWPGQNQPKGY